MSGKRPSFRGAGPPPALPPALNGSPGPAADPLSSSRWPWHRVGTGRLRLRAASSARCLRYTRTILSARPAASLHVSVGWNVRRVQRSPARSGASTSLRLARGTGCAGGACLSLCFLSDDTARHPARRDWPAAGSSGRPAPLQGHSHGRRPRSSWGIVLRISVGVFCQVERAPIRLQCGERFDPERGLDFLTFSLSLWVTPSSRLTP